ncbi:MAG: PadR family transcriptional regulator [Saprospiraceae bacterium]|nr:PadR family transcriptional regulator [Saprospiraceae bacterium]
MSRRYLGEFEEIVLLTVAVLDGKGYGIAIKDDIEQRLARKVSVGAMRTALKRLEGKGYLKSELGEPTAKRGGKRKRFFQVTHAGREVLEQVMDARKRLWQAIPYTSIDFKFA